MGHQAEIAVNHASPVQPLEQLVGQLKRAVLRDGLRPGDLLPSIRQLAADLELDTRTVAKAYDLLERNAVVQTAGRGRVRVSGKGKTMARLQAELSIALNIHDRLVSPVSFTNDRFEALGRSCPSSEVGGDLIDLVDHGGVTDLFLADVSGHGVGASLVMAMVKSSIRMGLRNEKGLSNLLGGLNEVLQSTTGPELFATLACMRVDREGRVQYALAGHHHLAHYRAATSELVRLDRRGMALGILSGYTYRTETVIAEPGDLLAVYTDGLHETRDAFDAELGHEPIEDALAVLAARPLPEIRQAVFDLAGGHGEQHDDRTLLLVRFF